MERYIGTTQAARITGIPERTLRRRAAAGELPAIRVGKLWKIDILEARLSTTAQRLLADLHVATAAANDITIGTVDYEDDDRPALARALRGCAQAAVDAAKALQQ